MRKPASVAELMARGLARCIEVGDCLEWQGKMACKGVTPVVSSREGSGYSAAHPVARYVWQAAHGPIPEGKLVYRKCCNNACVALAHLAVGTRAQWKANQKKQGRTKHTAERIAALTLGARNRANVRNTMEKAREVRALAETLNRVDVARMTGVSKAMVNDIVGGRSWKDHSSPFAGLGARP